MSPIAAQRLTAEERESVKEIESWWRTLEHQWLFLNELDSVKSICRHVEFYVDEHSTRLPHSAFQGQAPDEMYFGTAEQILADLEAKRREARAARKKVNRAKSCRVCQEVRVD